MRPTVGFGLIRITDFSQVINPICLVQPVLPNKVGQRLPTKKLKARS